MDSDPSTLKYAHFTLIYGKPLSSQLNGMYIRPLIMPYTFAAIAAKSSARFTAYNKNFLLWCSSCCGSIELPNIFTFLPDLNLINGLYPCNSRSNWISSCMLQTFIVYLIVHHARSSRIQFLRMDTDLLPGIIHNLVPGATCCSISPSTIKVPEHTIDSATGNVEATFPVSSPASMVFSTHISSFGR